MIMSSRNKVIVGISGLKGSGKTTIANSLHKGFGSISSIIPFAKPVKDLALSMGWDGIKNENGRKILQLLGTDIGRNLISPNIWINKWLNAVAESHSRVIIVDDLRFDNEVDVIVNNGGIIVKVVGSRFESKHGIKFHESEAGIKHHGHFVIDNGYNVLDVDLHPIIDDILLRLR